MGRAAAVARVAPLAAPSPGFGLGLRTAHYDAILSGTPRVDWFEAITDNYLVPGGKPIAMLEAVRARFPVALHGVSLSIGSVDGPDMEYVRSVRELAARIDPLWISDHLCWTGVHGRNLHDLLPLPYTEATVRLVARNIERVQEALGRRLVIENVSSYLEFADSTMPEWAFVRAVAERSDCLLLLDVNNIHVSARNHGFDAAEYLEAMPWERVQQVHIAGHTDHGDHAIDTHDEAVCDAVWELYRGALARAGPVATLLERDDRIPPLAELEAELDRARTVPMP